MKSAIFFSALIPVISAHTRFTTLFVNGQSQGDGTCMRMDMDPMTTNNFVSITSADMACGASGETKVALTCPLKAGDSISLLHRVWTDGSKPELSAIDPSHKGPTAVYMKKLADPGSSDPFSNSAEGDGWFKLAYIGYDENKQKWGTEIMNANNAMVDATVPSDLPGGYYLVRSEVLALQFHNGDTVQPQFYAGCAQVYVESSKTGDVSAKTVSIPGYVQADSPSLNYDIYSMTPPAQPYPEFGPTVYGSVSARDVEVEDRAVRSPRKVHGFKNPNYNNAVYEWGNLYGSSDLGSGAGTGTTAGVSSSTTAATPAASTTAASVLKNAAAKFSSTSASASTSASTSASSSVKSSATLSTDSSASTFVSTSATMSVSSSANSSASKSASTSASTSGAKPTSQSQSIAGSSSSGSTSSIVGLCPSDTVLTVANKCLEEVPSWSDDTAGALPKCWAASKECWNTSSNCWDNISPAINTNDMNVGCHAWENKCNALDDWCHAGNLQGPPAWTGGNAKTSRMAKRDVARHLVAAKRRGLRR